MVTERYLPCFLADSILKGSDKSEGVEQGGCTYVRYQPLFQRGQSCSIIGKRNGSLDVFRLRGADKFWDFESGEEVSADARGKTISAQRYNWEAHPQCIQSCRGRGMSEGIEKQVGLFMTTEVFLLGPEPSSKHESLSTDAVVAGCRAEILFEGRHVKLI
jgi:hypothetical protein